jgi:hypothetical protein
VTRRPTRETTDLLKTTKAIDLTIDPRVRFRADEVTPCVSCGWPYKSSYTVSRVRLMA